MPYAIFAQFKLEHGENSLVFSHADFFSPSDYSRLCETIIDDPLSFCMSYDNVDEKEHFKRLRIFLSDAIVLECLGEALLAIQRHGTPAMMSAIEEHQKRGDFEHWCSDLTDVYMIPVQNRH